jgi:hypothetical protein
MATVTICWMEGKPLPPLASVEITRLATARTAGATYSVSPRSQQFVDPEDLPPGAYVYEVVSINTDGLRSKAAPVAVDVSDPGGAPPPSVTRVAYTVAR